MSIHVEAKRKLISTKWNYVRSNAVPANVRMGRESELVLIGSKAGRRTELRGLALRPLENPGTWYEVTDRFVPSISSF